MVIYGCRLVYLIRLDQVLLVFRRVPAERCCECLFGLGLTGFVCGGCHGRVAPGLRVVHGHGGGLTTIGAGAGTGVGVGDSPRLHILV